MSGRATVRELRLPGNVPIWVHPGWQERLPWLVQGTTGRGAGEDPAGFDLGLFGRTPVGETIERWRLLRDAVGLPRAVHARQVHGRDLLVHHQGAPGLCVSEGYDGHLTGQPGILLTVSVADCVPISLVDERRRAVALLHGGWRGVAAGILEHGVARLQELAGSRASDLALHLGPAICGSCYEVGPEVFRALGLSAPAGPARLDLRATLAARAERLGIRPDRTSLSAFCTRCGDGTSRPFFSHRGGSPQRQLGLLAIRAEP